jgi:hypothetical protein
VKRKKNKDRQQRPQSSARPKISQSLWEFAGDFIRMGETLEHRQSYLNAVCSAWNIACNTPDVRKKHLDHYMREYQNFNSGADEEQLAGVRSDMEKLIEVKLKMFPHDLRQVVQARITKVGGQERIEAAALRVQ